MTDPNLRVEYAALMSLCDVQRETIARLTAERDAYRGALERMGCLYRTDPDDPEVMCTPADRCLRCAALGEGV